ncbi:hypothetical protein G6F59_014192 [Rhizopus arrhizus]|nr:hypothetical protein G6F59_014192 [Rhizopus arrhizus]
MVAKRDQRRHEGGRADRGPPVRAFRRLRGAAVQAHQQRDQRPHAGECQQGQRVDPIRQIVAAAADGWIAGVLRPQQGDQRAGDQCEHG